MMASAGGAQSPLQVELVRASIGYLVDFLHITPDCEAVVNFESPAAASHAAQILNGMSMLGSPPRTRLCAIVTSKAFHGMYT